MRCDHRVAQHRSKRLSSYLQILVVSAGKLQRYFRITNIQICHLSAYSQDELQEFALRLAPEIFGVLRSGFSIEPSISDNCGAVVRTVGRIAHSLTWHAGNPQHLVIQGIHKHLLISLLEIDGKHFNSAFHAVYRFDLQCTLAL